MDIISGFVKNVGIHRDAVGILEQILFFKMT